MSAAAPAPANTNEVKPAKSKKLLIIILAVVILLGGAGGAWFLLKPKADADGEEDAGHAAAAKHGPPPAFMPLESMVVNLADPGGDRYAQVAVTLEITDAKVVEQVKAYLPVIRSGVLMTISKRTSQDLLGEGGKEQLARDILREVSQPLGYEVPTEAEPEEADKSPKGEKKKAKAKGKKKAENPIKRVLFSSFIVQ